MRGEGGKTIMVECPVSTLKDKNTLDSIRGAPVALGHPPGEVNPGNWADLVVGNVVSELKYDWRRERSAVFIIAFGSLAIALLVFLIGLPG